MLNLHSFVGKCCYIMTQMYSELVALIKEHCFNVLIISLLHLPNICLVM